MSGKVKPTDPTPKADPKPRLAVAAPKPPAHWTVGDWGGFPNYKCNYCPFSTVDGEAAIEAHVVEKHLPELAAKKQPYMGNQQPSAGKGW